MFIGHFAVGFGLKRCAPRVSLGMLIAAALSADILWSAFLLLGWEHARIAPGDTKFTPYDLYDYPWSHSLAMMIISGALLALVYRWRRKDLTGAWAIACGGVSHWVLDWITHRPDMPLYPGGPKLGLGLWNSIPGTLVVELPLFCVGVWLYFTATQPRDPIGRWAFWIYVLLLLALYIGDRFGSPPDTVKEVGWGGLIASIVLVAWAWWFDAHRETAINRRQGTASQLTKSPVSL